MIFLRTLAFILRVQVRDLFESQNSLSLLGRILFVGITLIYALGCGLLLLFAEKVEINRTTLLFSINSAIAIFTVMKSYFPAYQPTTQPIATFYPMTRLQRAFMGILVDVFSAFVLTFLLFYAVMFAISFSALSASQILGSLLFFMGMVMLDRALRLAIEYLFARRALYVALILSMGALLIGQTAANLRAVNAFLSRFIADALPTLMLALPLVIFCGAALLLVIMALEAASPTIRSSAQASARKVTVGSAQPSLPRFIGSVFFGSSHVGKLLAIILLFKIFCFFYFWKIGLRSLNGDSEAASGILNAIIWIYVSPFVWFSNLLFNSFGLNWQLWQIFQERRGKSVLRLYFGYALLAMLADAVLTFPFLALVGQLKGAFVINWFASMLALLALGLVVSIVKPMKVEKLTSNGFASLKTVSSTMGTIVLFSLLILISVCSAINVYLPLSLPIMAWGAAWYIANDYEWRKYGIFEALHK